MSQKNLFFYYLLGALSKMSGKKKKKEPKVKKGDANSTIILTAANLNVVDLDDMYPGRAK